MIMTSSLTLAGVYTYSVSQASDEVPELHGTSDIGFGYNHHYHDSLNDWEDDIEHHPRHMCDMAAYVMTWLHMSTWLREALACDNGKNVLQFGARPQQEGW
jgi:hypothetical protein